MHRICSDEVRWKGTAFLKKNIPENSIGVDHWNLWCWLGKEVANFILFLGFLMVYGMPQSSQVVVYLIPWIMDPLKQTTSKNVSFCVFAFNYRGPYLNTPNCSGNQVVSQPAVQFHLHPQCLQCSVGRHQRPPMQLGSCIFFSPQPFRYQKQCMEPHHLGRFSMTRTLQQ